MVHAGKPGGPEEEAHVTQGHRSIGLQGPEHSGPQVHLLTLEVPRAQDSHGESEQRNRRQTLGQDKLRHEGRRARASFPEGAEVEI